ncbi:MAG: phosphatase PAP2 family protein [Verrucomicrobia bacterium]|nr:phosphatase PAP2 family protein [Verrucomicrobiota bacterium]
MIPFYDEQLRFVAEVAKYRNEALDHFFRVLNFFDTPHFFFVLVPILWLGLSWKWGLRITFLGVITGSLNYVLKLAVGWPRPCAVLQETVYYFPSPGFPSGAAQSSMLMAALLVYYWKSPWAKPIAAVYVLLVGFSRIYLGVHFPIDVLGGWAVGLALFFLFIYGIESLEKFLSAQKPLLVLALGLAIAVLLFPYRFHQASILAGAILGTYLSLQWRLYLPTAKSLRERAIRGVFGVAGFFLILYLWPRHQLSYLLFFILGLWISWIASPLYKSIFRRKAQ